MRCTLESHWGAATPQLFRLGELLAALDESLDANRMPSEDGQAVEWSGL